jgi:hypothetical protein
VRRPPGAGAAAIPSSRLTHAIGAALGGAGGAWGGGPLGGYGGVGADEDEGLEGEGPADHYFEDEEEVDEEDLLAALAADQAAAH